MSDDDVLRTAAVTDVLAGLVLATCTEVEVARALALLERVEVPARLVVTPPEGFAYYALAPEAYARAAVDEIAARGASSVLVVGIRSIGTTLSAMARAALRARGVAAERTTVRPSGSPAGRTLAFEGAHTNALAWARGRGAHVLVVDEGPGQSGSTFLATAEALARVGFASDRITMVCSHRPDPAKLGASRAVDRWRAFRTRVAPGDTREPAHAAEISGGSWRARLYDDEREWPAVWPQAERRKLLDRDGARLIKYEGLGRSGDEALARARTLAEAGTSLEPRDEGDGWVSYPWLEGARPLRGADLDESLLEQLAAACAARARLCPTTRPAEDLGPVVTKNLRVLFGASPREPLALPAPRPAIVNGRMAPHEWLRTKDGRVIATDAVSHGDDHFFPGPTDMAWDLAGMIVEWSLPERGCRDLVARYAALADDDASSRIDAWVVAYATTRAATMAVAAASLHGTPEHDRVARALAGYREHASRAIARAGIELLPPNHFT